MAQFRLVMRSGPAVGKIFPLEGSEISIGRDTSNKVAINDAEISRKHARILQQGEMYVLEDFGSTNGTFVNGQRLSGSTTIRAGDQIALGENVVLAFDADYDPDATIMASKPGKAASVVPAAPASAAPVAVRPPAQVAVPTPAYVPAPVPAPVVVPTPVYSGQVLESPVEPKKKNPKMLLIIIAAILLLCICGVSVFLFFAPTTFWCSLPFITWAPGACP